MRKPPELKALQEKIWKTWGIGSFEMKFLTNLKFWWGFAVIFNAFCIAMTAVTGIEVGSIPPSMAWVWIVGASVSLAMIQVTKTLQIQALLVSRDIDEAME